MLSLQFLPDSVEANARGECKKQGSLAAKTTSAA
jgi:hypothetical protein